jgi:hypothetical protein
MVKERWAQKELTVYRRGFSLGKASVIKDIHKHKRARL